MSDPFVIGSKAAEVDWYWQSKGYEMHYYRELEYCYKLIKSGVAKPYHYGYTSFQPDTLEEKRGER